jgi:hypothetical protein
MDAESDELVARGRVFVSTIAETGLMFHNPNADWQGEIDLVRAEGPELQDGTYTLIFEEGLAHIVQLRDVAAREEPSGVRARARLDGTDAVTLAVLTELSSGE